MKEYRLKNIENDYLCEEMSIKQSLEVNKKKKIVYFNLKLMKRDIIPAVVCSFKRILAFNGLKGHVSISGGFTAL